VPLDGKRGHRIGPLSQLEENSIGHILRLNEVAIAVVWSFLAGSIILNVLMRELPKESDTCFWSFVGGCAVHTALLIGK
jgi:hypothetical protein